MKRPDVIAFLHLLLDMFGPLRALSLTLQSDQTTLADVGEKIQVAKNLLQRKVHYKNALNLFVLY